MRRGREVDDADDASDPDDAPNRWRGVEYNDASTFAESMSRQAERVDAGRIHERELGELHPDVGAAAGQWFERVCQSRSANQVKFTRQVQQRRRLGAHGEQRLLDGSVGEVVGHCGLPSQHKAGLRHRGPEWTDEASLSDPKLQVWRQHPQDRVSSIRNGWAPGRRVVQVGGISACRACARPIVAPLMDDDRLDIQVGVPASMAAGRQTLRDHLHGWGCSNVDDVALVFSELVTNALMHTTGSSTTVITHGPSSVRIEVHDGSRSIPALRHDTSAGGFGLRIVSQLSDDWGWDQTSTGKVVWSTMPCGH